MKTIKRYTDYLLIAIVSFLIFSYIFDIWGKDILHIPFIYEGDGNFLLFNLKTLIKTGSIWECDYVGAPYGNIFYDYPNCDSFHILIMFLIGKLFNNNWVASMNVYYMLGFVLLSVITLYVLKKIGISKKTAFIGAILYTFLPYHFMRLGHLLLASYYMVPISILFCIKYFRGELVLDIKKIVCKDNIVNFILFVIIGTTGLYYAYFTCFFFCIIIFLKIIEKKFKYILNIILGILSIIIGISINFIPNLIYWLSSNQNSLSVQRDLTGGETYSFKLWQFIMPINGHRISILANIRNLMNKFPMLNENTEALGIIMSIGLFVLIFSIFVFANYNINKDIKNLSLLNLAAILLATCGGASTILGIILPQIRAYNRISVFIAMFCIVTICILIDYILIENKFKIKLFHNHIISYSIIFLIGIFGVFDQTSVNYRWNYEGIKQNYESDKSFIKQIENLKEDGAMIYQMPYVKFPESPPIINMIDYSHFKGYLHSDKLKWSYGVMKGTEGDIWMQSINEMSMLDRYHTIVQAGYSGIYIDRYAYTQEEIVTLENELRKIIGTEPILSEDGRLEYFDIR